MKSRSLSRREMIAKSGVALAASALPFSLKADEKSKALLERVNENFSYCLNVSTIRGQNVGFIEEIELASQAGYDGIEIWIPPLNEYVANGGSLSDLKKRIDDLGIQVENAIGFAQWIVNNNDQRMRAMEQAKKEMDMLAQLGCKRIAAPPAGATNQADLNLDRAAERFRALVELGVNMGVIPQLEVWGFSKCLHKLSQVLYVAAECGHPATRILPDVYHLFKGGSDFDGLKLMSGESIEILHMNDYPDKPSREEMTDAHRVYPGDGVGPVTEVIQSLIQSGGPKVLSLELFNRDYYKQDAMTVAKTGLEKMKSAVAAAMK